MAADVLRWRRAVRRLAVLALLFAAGCGASAPHVATQPLMCAAPCQRGSGPMRVATFVEPEAGAAPILAALATATTSIDAEIYQLSDTRVIHALEDAANRGVAVRVILEFAPFGDAGVSAQVTAEELRAAGVRSSLAIPHCATPTPRSSSLTTPRPTSCAAT
jgi:phosphatidylserine/phosphatidylglycerophosphate/cardiolipin synthase-like enzyme